MVYRSSPSLAGVLLLTAGLFFSACASTADRDASREPAEDRPAEFADLPLADYEDFDASAFPEAELSAAVEVQHEVPEALMTGQAGEENVRRLQGYRIQIFSTDDKAAADDQLEAALAWWREQREEGAIQQHYPGRSAEPPVHLVYRQPYYRIRVGDFVSEAQARQFLVFVKQRFPDAFLARDVVTVRE